MNYTHIQLHTMSRERFEFNSAQKENEEINDNQEAKVTSVEDYLESIEKSPVKEIPLDLRILHWDQDRKKIEAKLRNDRVARQMKALVATGIIFETGKVSCDQIDKYIEEHQRDGNIEYIEIPVWNENGEVSGYTTYRG